jgi:hypothetical protein
MSFRRAVYFFFGITSLIVAGSVQAASITLNTNTTYQTMQGWVAVMGASLSPFQTTQFLNRGGNELGLTAFRLDCPFNGNNATAGRSWTFRIDGTNPSRTNWASFDTLPGVSYNTNSGVQSMDESMTQWIVPMKQLVTARGDPFILINNPSFYYGGSTGNLPSWMQYNYGEYAEYLVSFDEYQAHHYGVVPTYNTIINEAGNNNAMTPFLEAKVIKAMGPMLAAAGLSTKIQLAEGVGANVSQTYATDTNMDSEVWKYVGTASYHNYQGTSSNKAALYAAAVSHGVATVEEEMVLADFHSMYDDLVNGGVSIWGQYGIGGYASGAGTQYYNANYDGASITVPPQYWNWRQVMYYVRPGAVRIGTTSSDTNVLVMAFQKNGKLTVVMSNIDSAGNKTNTVSNLPPGVYGVSESLSAGGIAELGLQTVDSFGVLMVTNLYGSILTIYPYAGTNLPPEIYEVPGTADSSPTYLKTGAGSSATLTIHATDPELDPLTYNWQLLSVPSGAIISLVNSNSSVATANNLIVTGLYTFVASVSDNHGNTATRQVGLNVLNGNQPPIVQVVQSRSPPGPPYVPILVTLPTNTTWLLAQIEVDLEGNTLSNYWSLVSQPPGAAATLATPGVNNCIVSNMTVAGDYAFQLNVSDGFNVVTKNLTVTVDPPNLHAPTIANVSGAYVSPGHGHLQATASDADGDWISSWWDVLSKPAGSTVMLDDPATPATDFHVDTVGTYIFQLSTVDRTLWSQSGDISITVTNVPIQLSITPLGNSMLLTWPAAGVRTNVLQAAVNVSGAYSNISSNVLISGNGVTNNFLDIGAVTNWPARFYRVQQVQ